MSLDLEFLSAYAKTCRFRLGAPKNVTVTPENTVLFLRSSGRSFSHDLFEFNPADGTERVLLTANEILRGAEEKLSPEEKAKRERMRESSTGIVSYSLSGPSVLIRLANRLFVIDRQTKAITELPQGSFPNDPSFSPDRTKVACVRDGCVQIIEVETQAETALTSCSSSTVTTGLAEFVAQEEMHRFQGYWWYSNLLFK
jgi:dipeptidyl-peptidase-4